MARILQPYHEDFATLKEQDAYIRRQLQFFHLIPDKATDEAGWLAMKLTCTRRKAQALINQMRARRKACPGGKKAKQREEDAS